MREDGLSLQTPKTRNLVMSPLVLEGGIYRGAPLASALATRARRQGQYSLAAREHRRLLEFEVDGDLGLPPEETLGAEGFPYPLVDSMRVLGVHLDAYGSLDDQFPAIPAKAQARQGVLAKVAHRSWRWRPTSCASRTTP